LPGYRESRPVRKGNGALHQTQLDIFGELAHCIYLYWKHPGFDHSGENFERDEWPLLQSCAKYVAKNWQQRGSGIWEMRGPELHHTESKAMCWLLLDRTIKLARDFGIESPHLNFWKKQRDRLYNQFTTRGYSRTHRAFVQAYDSPVADAALLRLPLLGVVDANQQPMRDTVAFIERELLDNGLLYRYRQVEDGISGEEGTFTVCSFWLIENYVLQNRVRDAEQMFDRVLSLSNDLTLMSEEINPGNGDLLGNFPQGFTHIGIINAAVRMAKAKEGGVPEAHAVLTEGNAPKAA
jgi:GH15 family glucan-1,4-alpha-glucosidase